MGIFTDMKNKTLDPWFCIVCDLGSGRMKLPLEMENDPCPEIKLSDRMVRGKETARLYVRAGTAKEAKIRARIQLDAYDATRSSKKRRREAA